MFSRALFMRNEHMKLHVQSAYSNKVRPVKVVYCSCIFKERKATKVIEDWTETLERKVGDSIII